jgi:drug/metabolite transporter (DMT)-like permease
VTSATSAGPRADRTLPGIAFMIAGVLCFTVVDATAKHLVSVLPVFEMIFVRQIMVMALSMPMLWYLGGWRALRTKRPLEHLVRAGSVLIAMLTFFVALRTVPLATAIAIGQAAPLFMTALSVPMLGERVGKWRWSAVVLGFAGVLVIIQPGGAEAIDSGVWLVLFSALCFAVTMVMVRRLSSTEPNISLFFWANLLSLLATAPVAPFVWVTPESFELALMALMAVALLAAQWLTAHAFRLAPVAVVAPFQYLEIAGGAWFGWLFWREAVALNVWIGAAIVVASGTIIVWRERVRMRQP